MTKKAAESSAAIAFAEAKEVLKVAGVTKGKKVVLAPQKKIKRNADARTKLKALLHAMCQPDAMVTDRSMMSDFFYSEDPDSAGDLKKAITCNLKWLFGVSFEPNDFICDVADRILIKDAKKYLGEL